MLNAYINSFSKKIYAVFLTGKKENPKEWVNKKKGKKKIKLSGRQKAKQKKRR